MRPKQIERLSADRIEKAKIVASMNNKGGCGKTTSAVSFGIHMSRIGKRVLFVDADQQSNMSQRLGLSDGMSKDSRISELFKRSDMENINNEHLNYPQAVRYPYLSRAKGTNVKPGIIALLAGSHNAEIEATAAEARLRSTRFEKFIDVNQFFRNTMEEYKKYFDYIVIDTAPAMEGNVLNKVAVTAADEIICPIDGLEAALGIHTFISWVYGQTLTQKAMPNITLAMVKYQVDTKAIGDTSNLNLRNSVYRYIKQAFSEFVCDNGVKEQRSMKHSVQGFRKTDYSLLADELDTKFMAPDRANIFDSINPETLLNLSQNLAIIEKKTITKKPDFRPMLFN